MNQKPTEWKQILRELVSREPKYQLLINQKQSSWVGAGDVKLIEKEGKDEYLWV